MRGSEIIERHGMQTWLAHAGDVVADVQVNERTYATGPTLDVVEDEELMPISLESFQATHQRVSVPLVRKSDLFPGLRPAKSRHVDAVASEEDL